MVPMTVIRESWKRQDAMSFFTKVCDWEMQVRDSFTGDYMGKPGMYVRWASLVNGNSVMGKQWYGTDGQVLCWTIV